MTDVDLRLFLAKREIELKAQYEPLLDRRKALRNELDQLTMKLLSLSREIEEIDKTRKAIGDDAPPDPDGKLTIKEAVLKVLQDEKRGMTAQQILVAINQRYFDGTIARSSLSPQLSRLNHNDKKVSFDGTFWSLRNENDEGSANAEPSFLD